MKSAPARRIPISDSIIARSRSIHPRSAPAIDGSLLYAVFGLQAGATLDETRAHGHDDERDVEHHVRDEDRPEPELSGEAGVHEA